MVSRLIPIFLFCLISNFGSAQIAEDWIPLFNGESLEGWQPKIRGQAFGKDSLNTFTVKDGAIVVNYDNYPSFEERFGHLFYELPFSAYVLDFEYKFFSDQVHDGPNWAFKNSGIMFHCQNPVGMDLNQDFPISLELQLLGSRNPSEDRPTMNLCTPGTTVDIDGNRITQHCINSSGPSISDDQWVKARLIVYPDQRIEHHINGSIVLSYQKPQYDSKEPVKSGFIALQSESHPVAFRNIRIKELN